uniref:Uncharacterized protein n=1 Tax=Anguilla anguilla TaxID=7936 RepID=A0A0E9XGF4_ANGAN
MRRQNTAGRESKESILYIASEAAFLLFVVSVKRRADIFLS